MAAQRAVSWDDSKAAQRAEMRVHLTAEYLVQTKAVRVEGRCYEELVEL